MIIIYKSHNNLKEKEKIIYLIYSFFQSWFFHFLSLLTSVACVLLWLVVCMLLFYWLVLISLTFLYFAQSGFCFCGSSSHCTWWRKACFFKPVVQFSFTYGVSKGFLYICLSDKLFLNNVDLSVENCIIYAKS